jgi:pyrroloquinoline quinone biosynthesis protein B
VIVRILGSAAGGGVPQWNCGCSICSRTRNGELPARTQSSVAVSADGNAWILVNASIDLPKQFAVTPELWPDDVRATPMIAVCLTDANVDHTAGLGELRQNPGPLVIVSSPVTRSLLAGERAFERFARPPHRWLGVEPDGQDVAAGIDTGLAGAMEVRVHDVPGLLPGYAGREPARGAVVAFEFVARDSGARLLVAPVCLDYGGALLELVTRSDVALLDGSFYSDDELAAAAAGAKAARAIGHAPVGQSDGTLARVAALPNRRVFIHVNNTNPMLDPHSLAAAAVREAGCEVASDGQVIRL